MAITMRKDYEEGTEIAAKILMGGLVWEDTTMTREEFENVDTYLQDDGGSVVLSFTNGAVLVVVQSIDCDWD